MAGQKQPEPDANPNPNAKSGCWSLGLGKGSVCRAGSQEPWWEVLNMVLMLVRNHSAKSKRTGKMTSGGEGNLGS